MIMQVVVVEKYICKLFLCKLANSKLIRLKQDFAAIFLTNSRLFTFSKKTFLVYWFDNLSSIILGNLPNFFFFKENSMHFHYISLCRCTESFTNIFPSTNKIKTQLKPFLLVCRSLFFLFFSFIYEGEILHR